MFPRNVYKFSLCRIYLTLFQHPSHTQLQFMNCSPVWLEFIFCQLYQNKYCFILNHWHRRIRYSSISPMISYNYVHNTEYALNYPSYNGLLGSHGHGTIWWTKSMDRPSCWIPESKINIIFFQKQIYPPIDPDYGIMSQRFWTNNNNSWYPMVTSKSLSFFGLIRVVWLVCLAGTCH